MHCSKIQMIQYHGNLSTRPLPLGPYRTSERQEWQQRARSKNYTDKKRCLLGNAVLLQQPSQGPNTSSARDQREGKSRPQGKLADRQAVSSHRHDGAGIDQRLAAMKGAEGKATMGQWLSGRPAIRQNATVLICSKTQGKADAWGSSGDKTEDRSAEGSWQTHGRTRKR